MTVANVEDTSQNHLRQRKTITQAGASAPITPNSFRIVNDGRNRITQAGDLRIIQ